MNRGIYKLLRAFCMYVFILSALFFLKTKDQGIWVGIYFTTALFAKIAELILWIYEPEKPNNNL